MKTHKTTAGPGKGVGRRIFRTKLFGAVFGQQGDGDAAKKYLMEARDTARLFDANPTYAVSSLKFCAGVDATAYDDMGPTALEAVRSFLETQEVPGLQALWESLETNG